MASFRVLQSLIQRGMHDELRARLEHDAQLANAEDSDGRHLVHYAAIKSRAECLKVLLQHGGEQKNRQFLDVDHSSRQSER